MNIFMPFSCDFQSMENVAEVTFDLQHKFQLPLKALKVFAPFFKIQFWCNKDQNCTIFPNLLHLW